MNKQERASGSRARFKKDPFFWRGSPLFPPSDQRQQPYDFYAGMRRDQPVAHDARSGLWAVYCYDDVKRVLTEYRVFSSDRTRIEHPAVTESDGPLRGNSLRSCRSRAVADEPGSG